ncbi:MAG TPA: fumarylacetoacetate hydrolase family protein [Burkholderiales bacterium]|nr:fumarylacetoacetate hydrolase family protein [Burkholderiales bacterium]
MSAAWYDPRIARGMAQQLTRWHQRIKSGEKALGWKAGFGTSEAMERYKLHAPLIGHLMDATALRNGETVSLEGWARPLAEAEIAVIVGKDVPRGASREAAANAIAGLAPAIELVDLDTPPEDVTAILSGNIYHRRVILGARDNNRGGSVEGYSGTVMQNGQEIATVSALQESTGDYVELVRHVADLLAAFGERLAAGQVIITGAVVPPLPVQPGGSVTFKLNTGAEASVRFKG